MIDRRRFLVMAGAALTAPLAVWLGAEALSDDTAPASLRVPEDAVDPRQLYSLGAPTTQLLARKGASLVVPEGTWATPYEVPAPADDTTWDMRRARFVGYFDADARYQTGEFAGGSTEQQRNNRPIRIGYRRPVGGGAVVGALVEGPSRRPSPGSG